MIDKIVALRCLAVAGSLAWAVSAASAQLSISSGSELKPHLMCKAWTGEGDVMFGSGEVANQPNAEDRFRYHARKYGEQIGQQIYTDCVDFDLISADYRRSFEPGGSFMNYRDEPKRVVQATFLPPGWESTPTPEEKGRKADRGAKRSTPASTPAAPAGTSQAELAAEQAAARRAEREAEFQRKHAAFERDLAEQKRKVEEFERANEDIARKKAEQQARADAVLEAFRRQSEAHAELMRRHQQETIDYRTKLAGPAGPTGPVENLGLRKFQATSPFRKTRDEAMRALSAPNGQELTDVQCAQVKGFDKEWSCWGFYLQETTRSGVSRQ